MHAETAASGSQPEAPASASSPARNEANCLERPRSSRRLAELYEAQWRKVCEDESEEGVREPDADFAERMAYFKDLLKRQAG